MQMWTKLLISICIVDWLLSVIFIYSQKRVKAFKNGDPLDKYTFAWGSSITEIMQDSTMRLDLRKAAVQLYTVDGEKLNSIDEIKRDQLVCVSYGDHFKGSKGECCSNLEWVFSVI